MSTAEETPAAQPPPPANDPDKEEPKVDPIEPAKDESEGGPTPWDFLTINPDTESSVKKEGPDAPLLLAKPDEKATEEAEDDKTLDKDDRTFIEALDHLSQNKAEQDSYFYEQGRYGEQILFPENALLDVASEETIDTEGECQ